MAPETIDVAGAFTEASARCTMVGRNVVGRNAKTALGNHAQPEC
jgi:hypothetical protein